jgi:hypothetical protein
LACFPAGLVPEEIGGASFDLFKQRVIGARVGDARRFDKSLFLCK